MRIHIHKCHAKSEKIVNSLKKDIEKDVKIPICRIDCSVCGKSISKKWFKYHMVVHERKDISTDRHHFTVRIDSERGVFLSDKTLQGRYIPIHLIKKTSGTKHLFICEDLHCIDQKNIALRGGNTSFECAHMRSVPFAVPGKVLDLNINVLENLVASGFISDSRSKQMLKLKDVSESQHIPFVVEAPNPPHSSSRFINLSVFSGTQRYWSRLDRTVVYIDTLKQHVKCRCSKSSDYCTHKAIAKWFLKQERPEYFQSEKREISDIEIDSECDTSEFSDGDVEDKVTSADKKSETFDDTKLNFIKQKKIPVDVPVDLSKSDLLEVIPSEEKCHLCQGILTKKCSSKCGKLILMCAVMTGELTAINRHVIMKSYF